MNVGRRACATLLQAQSSQDLLKFGVHAEFRQFDMDTTTQTGAKVGGASEDVSQVLIPHEAMVVLLEHLLNLEPENETSENELKMHEECGRF